MTAALSTYYERAEQRRAQVVELTRLGRTIADIAAALRISERHVSRIRAEQGIARPKPPLLSEEELRIAAEMLDDGASYAEVARTLGRHHRAIAVRFPGRGWDKGEGARLAMYRRWICQRVTELEGL